jgi:Tfp pilus assembly protein PilF
MLARPYLVALGVAWASTGCKTVVPIHPRAAEHTQYCAEYLAQGDLEKAETRCHLALEFNPDMPEPYNLLGLIEMRRDHWDAAKEYYIKAIHLNQDLAEAHNNLGYYFLHVSQLGKAHDEFLRALKVNPDYMEARYNLALTYMRLKQDGDAKKVYRELIESNPNIADPHHDLCSMDIDEGDFTTAAEECREAIRLDPKYVSAYFNLGNAYLKAGKFCEAQEAYTDCLRVDQENAECRNNVTIATRKCALLDPNLREAASGPKPGDATAPEGNGTEPIDLMNKGKAQLTNGLVNEARRNFRKCVRKDPNFSGCWYQLFKLDQQVQDNSSAGEDCKNLLRSAGEEAQDQRDECKTFLSSDGQ